MNDIEQQFFKTFGIEPNIIVSCNTGFYNFYKGFRYSCDATNCKKCKSAKKDYPQITSDILLKLLCIYNDMQRCIDFCIVPGSYEDTKDMILNTLINEKLSMSDYEEGTYMDVMTKRIRVLFGGEE